MSKITGKNIIFMVIGGVLGSLIGAVAGYMLFNAIWWLWGSVVMPNLDPANAWIWQGPPDAEARLWWILGGAFFVAVLGVILANFLFKNYELGLQKRKDEMRTRELVSDVLGEVSNQNEAESWLFEEGLKLLKDDMKESRLIVYSYETYKFVEKQAKRFLVKLVEEKGIQLPEKKITEICKRIDKNLPENLRPIYLHEFEALQSEIEKIGRTWIKEHTQEKPYDGVGWDNSTRSKFRRLIISIALEKGIKLDDKTCDLLFNKVYKNLHKQ